MPTPDQKLSILLTGTQDSRTDPEYISPVVGQGTVPTLREAANTRLSVNRGTCTRSPQFNQAYNVAVSDACYGIVPAERGKSTLLAFGPATGHRRIADAGRVTAGNALSYQPPWLPFRLSALQSPEVHARIEPSMAYDPGTGYVWVVYLVNSQSSSSQVTLYAYVLDTATGSAVVQPTELASFTTPSSPWCGVTVHGAGLVRIWYFDSTNVVGKVVTISNSYLFLGATIFSQVLADVCFDITSDGSTYAYLASCSPASVNDGRVWKIHYSTGAFTTVDYGNALNGSAPNTAIAYSPFSDAGKVCVVYSSQFLGTSRIVAYTTGLVASWTATDVGYGPVSVAFYQGGSASGKYAVVMRYDPNAIDFSTPASGYSNHVSVTAYPITGGAGVSYRLTSAWLASHATTWNKGTDEYYPLIATSRSYSTGNAGPLDPDYVADQGITLWLLSLTTNNLPKLAPVARYGVIHGSAQNPAIRNVNILSSKGLIPTATNKILACYLKNGGTGSIVEFGGYVAKFTEIDTSAQQPPLAYDRVGVTHVAAACPVQWDGTSIVEEGAPFHAPHCKVDVVAGGAAPVWPDGVYKVCVVVHWADAAGDVHRSYVSPVQTITTAGGVQKGQVYASLARNNVFFVETMARKMTAVAYVSVANGTAMYAQPWAYTDYNEYILFGASSAPAVGGAQLYSDGTVGQARLPQPPPPLHDIWAIGSRLWGVDAEVRSRVVYSKLRVSGVGYEWDPALEVILPAGAGDIMAVRDWQGQPILLTKYGVYGVSGGGPSNVIGDTQGYNDPVRMSDVGCTNTYSVLYTPVGIFWQNGDYLVRWSGGVQQITNFQVSDISSAVLLRNQDEALFFERNSAKVYVYNYSLDRWTTWDSATWAYGTKMAVSVPHDANAVLVRSDSTTYVHRIDAATTGTAASARWDTGWLLPGGDFQDHVIVRKVVFNGQIAGAHSLTVKLFMDYETTASSQITWTSGELAAIAVDGKYTVSLEPTTQCCRAIRIQVSDSVSGTTGVQPRSLTVQYAVEAPFYAEAFKQGSEK